MIDATQPTAPEGIEGFAPPEHLICWAMEQICGPNDRPRAPNGQFWMTVVCDGVKQEAHAVRTVFDAEQDAWVAYNATFAELAQPHVRCYFRQLPRAVQVPPDPPGLPPWEALGYPFAVPPETVGKWYIRSRLMFA